MNIYLAGGITGNLFPLWRTFGDRESEKLKKVMDIYLVAPLSSRPFVILNNDSLPLYKTEGDSSLVDDKGKVTLDKKVYDINILESFYYARANKVVDRLIPYIGNFLLDSGAFTFMSSTQTVIDWDAYVEDYAGYIKTRKITKFFELDIDSIVGLAEVERLRAKLENLVGLPPIPVWHLGRGRDYFIKMCQRYPYVSIGGIVTEEIKRNKYERLFPWFIKTAHEHGSKIHALGYTGKLKRYRFDSVDSTAWLYGNRGGYLYRFDSHRGEMEKIDPPSGMRLKSQEASLFNFNEWVKYCQWAKRYL